MSVRFQSAKIVRNTEVSNGFWVIEIECPEIAGISTPGQFIMIAMANSRCDPLLPRAFSMARRTAHTLVFLYRVVGRGTEVLAAGRPGDELSIWGPLGRGFSVSGGTPLLVGGGTGIAPLIDLGEDLNRSGTGYTLACGGRTAGDLRFMDGFSEIVAYVPYTEDGSLGEKGYVTEHLRAENITPDTVVYSCGPMGMLRRVSELAAELGVPCQLSIETPMACGLGTCLGCAIPRRYGGGYFKTCTDGPVFNSTEVVL